MNRSVRESLADVNAVVLVVEPPELKRADRDVLALVPIGVPIIAAVNKVDRVADKIAPPAAAGRDRARCETSRPSSRSAPRRSGCSMSSWRRSRSFCPPGRALYPADEMTDRDERFLAAEFIREKIFRRLGEELPYATTVKIDSFEEEGKLRRIHATVLRGQTEASGDPGGRGRQAHEGDRLRRQARHASGSSAERCSSKSGCASNRAGPSDERKLARLGY